MTILNVAVLTAAVRQRPDAANAIGRWEALTAVADWRSLMDVRDTFPSADGVSVTTAGRTAVIATVFNIRGNRYRLITVVDYAGATVSVQWLLTHAEYAANRWKGQL